MNTWESSPIISFDYFAYGSNMLTPRLKKRCLNPIEIRYANADDRIIEFSKLSKDCSGKATLRLKTGHQTPGVLFSIPISERDKLDTCEGAGKGYIRWDDFPVRLTESNEVVYTTTYLAACPSSDLKPYDWYLALVIAGVLEHDLGAKHHSMLQRVPYLTDQNCDRTERCKALDVLAEAGYSDYRCLLSPA